MVLSGWRARVVARSPPNTVQHTIFISHHFPLSNIPFHPQDQGKGSTVPLGWGWEGILGVFRAGLRAESKFLPFQNLGIIGDNLMCSSLLPAQLCREHCFWWLVVNVLCRAPLWGALPPFPIPSPPPSTADTTQRQNLSDGQEEQCRGRDSTLLPPQNWGEGESSLDLPSVSTTQDKGCQIHSLPCVYCTGKQTT